MRLCNDLDGDARVSSRNFRWWLSLLTQDVHVRKSSSEELCQSMGLCAILTGKLKKAFSAALDNSVFQALPIAFGVPLVGYLNHNSSGQTGYYLCAACSIVGSLTLFLVDLHKRNVSRHKDGNTK